MSNYPKKAYLFRKFFYVKEIILEIVVFRTKDGNNDPIVAIINFFGSVECENIEHEVRGLNVYVRLRKSLPMMWPRLLLASDKCTWIVQNMEAFPEEREIDSDDQNSDPIGEKNQILNLNCLYFYIFAYNEF